MATKEIEVILKRNLLTAESNILGPMIVPRSWTLTAAYAYSDTAADADSFFDVNINGVSIWDSDQTQRLKILNTASSGNKTGLSVAYVLGDKLSVDYDGGASTLGGNLYVFLLFTE